MKREKKNNSCDMETTQGEKRNKFLELGVLSSKEYLEIELKGGTGQTFHCVSFINQNLTKGFK